MTDENLIQQFSGYLFWDVDASSINMEGHAPYIVKRVLERGQLNDWKLLQSYYGLERIAEISMGLRDLDPKALSFIATISHTPKENFRCYTERQSAQRHWISLGK